MAKPQTFIFFGRSGCGKGTQAKLIKEYLEKLDSGQETLYVETGAKFREFVARNNHSSLLVKAVIDAGNLLPAFLPIWLWTDFFINNLKGDEHLVLDGLSRRAIEAPVLDSAMRFYNRERPYVILINVSEKWAKERLLARGRHDDSGTDIDRRFSWYKSDVMPTLEFFRNNPYYKFIEVNGEQMIEEVHRDIIAHTNILMDTNLRMVTNKKEEN